jgi:GntR family transcriptional regulator, vanillate catabolism transcriptional regulator
MLTSSLADTEDSLPQAVRAQQRLREAILRGDLPAGQRVTELMLVEQLQMSRTPVRTALLKLEQEGLLQGLSGGGFAVRVFSEEDVADTIELRGMLEGLVARRAAERGVAAPALAQARQSLKELDAHLEEPQLSDALMHSYVRLNAAFHQWLARVGGSEVLSRELERVCSLPFASPSGFVGLRLQSSPTRDLLMVAQHQHHQVLQAIEQREGARAEALMREHSRIAQHNLRQALSEAVRTPSGPVREAPALALIQRATDAPRRASGQRSQRQRDPS